MKRSVIVACFLMAIAFGANAQTKVFQSFKLDVGGGLDFLSGNSASLIFTAEPHYRLLDEFAVGLRFQAAISLGQKASGTELYLYSSNCLTGDYYVTDLQKPVAVFLGGGVGVFTQEDTKNKQVDNFGFFPRIGLEVKRFRASIEYNYTGGARNYFSVNAGVFFWGKRK